MSMKKKVIISSVVAIFIAVAVFFVFYLFIVKTTDYYTIERNSTEYGKWFDYLSPNPDYKIRKFSSDATFEDELYIQGLIRGGNLKHAKEEILKAIPDTTDSRYKEAIERLYYKEIILVGITHTKNNKVDEDLIKKLITVQSSQEMEMYEKKHNIEVQMDIVPEL